MGSSLRLADFLASWEVVFVWQSWTGAPDSADLREQALPQLLGTEVQLAESWEQKKKGARKRHRVIPVFHFISLMLRTS